MLGTSSSPVAHMLCTMPRPTASCVFQGSCPVRPGRMNAAAIRTSATGAGGSLRRGSIAPVLLGLLRVAALELLDPAGGVHDLGLAGVERVRLGRDLDLDHRVLLAVGPFHGLAALGINGGAGEEGGVRAGVEENHRPVFGG